MAPWLLSTLPQLATFDVQCTLNDPRWNCFDKILNIIGVMAPMWVSLFLFVYFVDLSSSKLDRLFIFFSFSSPLFYFFWPR